MSALKDAYTEQLICENIERLRCFGYSERMIREEYPWYYGYTEEDEKKKIKTFEIKIYSEEPGAKTVTIYYDHKIVESYESNKPNRRIIGSILSGDANINNLIESKISKEDKKKYKVLNNCYNEKGIRLKVSGEIKDYVKFFNGLGCKCSYDRHKLHSRFVIEKEKYLWIIE